MPNLHPFLVHFPIALLFLSLILDAIALLRKSPELSRAAWWNQIGGTAGLALTVASGLLAQDTVSIVEDAKDLFQRHEQLAFLSAAIFAGLLLWRSAARGKIPRQSPAAYFLLFAAGVACVMTGAWYGGEMVFRYGVGVK